MAGFITSDKAQEVNDLTTQLEQIVTQPIIEVTENRIVSATDLSKKLHFNSTSNLTCTIPPDADMTANVGIEFTVVRINTGTVTFVAGSGVTINSVDSAKAVSGRYGGVIAYKTAANTWTLIGALE